MMVIQVKYNKDILEEFSSKTESIYNNDQYIDSPDPWVFEADKRVLLLDSTIKIMDDTYSDHSSKKKIIFISTSMDLGNYISEFEALADRIAGILKSDDDQISVVGSLDGVDVAEFHINGIRYQQLVRSSIVDNPSGNNEPIFEEVIHLYVKEFHRKGRYT